MTINKNKIKNFFIGFFWITVAAGCITLLASGVHSKNAKRCKGVEIEISGVNNNFFIDKNDVYAIIKRFGGDSTGRKTLAGIDLKRIEKELEKDLWIKNAELFFNNNDILKVSVQEREPVARIFTVTGNTFYIDSSCMILPLSDKFSARLPVFTGFTSDAKIVGAADSSLLFDIKNISLKIAADSFLMAMIDETDITATRSFEMIPKVGKQLIIFGDVSDAEAKFAKLKMFYKDVIAQSGWNRYKIINLQYKDQVVGVIRGKADIIADSLKTLSIMKFIADDAARRAADSSQNFVQDTDKNSADSSMILQSIQRDEGGDRAPDAVVTGVSAIPAISVPKPATAAQAPVPATKKPAAAVIKKPAPPKPKPKPGIKKPENDY